MREQHHVVRVSARAITEAARRAASAAYASNCVHAATVVDPRGCRSACGRIPWQSQRLPTARRTLRVRDLGLRDKHAADSIPIARHRLCGRFSPTGSFAYRTRGRRCIGLPPPCTPRPPGKRLSAFLLPTGRGGTLHRLPPPARRPPGKDSLLYGELCIALPCCRFNSELNVNRGGLLRPTSDLVSSRPCGHAGKEI
jgi:hypothetical protein